MATCDFDALIWDWLGAGPGVVVGVAALVAPAAEAVKLGEREHRDEEHTTCRRRMVRGASSVPTMH